MLIAEEPRVASGLHIRDHIPHVGFCLTSVCRDAGKGRRSLQNHWFLLSLAVTLNEILHFPPFQEEGHAPLLLGNPGDLVTICPGESGLVSRGSQGLRSPLESRRGALGAP